jgi:hypothetical protein
MKLNNLVRRWFVEWMVRRQEKGLDIFVGISAHKNIEIAVQSELDNDKREFT